MLGSLHAQGSKALLVGDAKALGFDVAALAAFDADIAGGKYGNVDSLLVMQRGEIAFVAGIRMTTTRFVSLRS